MKCTTLLVVILNILTACNNIGESKKPPTDTLKITEAPKEEPIKTEKSLFKQADDIRKMLGSKDINKIKEVFNFPISDSAFDSFGEYSEFSEDPAYITYIKDIENNKGLITEELFSKYFNKMAAILKLDLLSEIPSDIKTDTAKLEKGLEYTWGKTNKDQACIKYYRISYYKEDSLVILRYGYQQNPDFINKSNDDSLDCHEPDHSFQFKFDGKKLTFLRQTTAG